ncbi:MAG: endonuclease [Dehalococcoidales bacterium]|nr:endonuclease [Dehalococcoidales bacterium]
MDKETIGQVLQDVYFRLLERYGPQYWWPADEPFEVMVGAILTQSAAWINVEKAITNLKAAKALSPHVLRTLRPSDIAALVHPCGYYNVKALKLKSLACWLGEYCGDNLDKLFASSIGKLRQQLLSVYGIGEETADSIILYAANKPIFVIDAYTRRIISRLGLTPDGNSYAAYQALFMENLPADVRLFNEYHALLVCLGKRVCRGRPLCQQCCLKNICYFSTNGECLRG